MKFYPYHILFMLSLPSMALAQPYYTEFTQGGGAYSGAPVAGTVNGVNVTLGGPYSSAGLEGWENTYSNGSTIFAAAPFSMAQPLTDALVFRTGASSATPSFFTTYTIAFSSPVTDPFLHVRGLEATTLDFSAPLTVISSDGALISGGSSLIGSDAAGPFFMDGSGTVQFSGLHSTLTFDVSNTHFDPANTFELAVGYEDATPVPEASSAFLLGSAMLLLGIRRRRG